MKISRIVIKEPAMEIGTNTLKLIIEAAKTPGAYNLETSPKFKITVKFPKGEKVPTNLLKKMKNDIGNILKKKPPTQVLYPWVIEEYSTEDLKLVLKHINKGKVKLVRK